MSEATASQRRQQERQRHRRRRHVRSSANASFSAAGSDGDSFTSSNFSSDALVDRPWLGAIPLQDLRLTDLLFHCDKLEHAFKVFLARILSVENYFFWQESVEFHLRVERGVLSSPSSCALFASPSPSLHLDASTSRRTRSDGITSPALASGTGARAAAEAVGGISEREGRRIFVLAEHLYSSYIRLDAEHVGRGREDLCMCVQMA